MFTNDLDRQRKFASGAAAARPARAQRLGLLHRRSSQLGARASFPRLLAFAGGITLRGQGQAPRGDRARLADRPLLPLHGQPEPLLRALDAAAVSRAGDSRRLRAHADPSHGRLRRRWSRCADPRHADDVRNALVLGREDTRTIRATGSSRMSRRARRSRSSRSPPPSGTGSPRVVGRRPTRAPVGALQPQPGDHRRARPRLPRRALPGELPELRAHAHARADRRLPARARLLGGHRVLAVRPRAGRVLPRA